MLGDRSEEASELDIAWLAGLLEGEGSFLLPRRARGAHLPKIIVSMTDQDVIQRVADLWGRSVYAMPIPKKYPDRKQQWRTQVDGSAAIAWMMRLLPQMGKRRSAKITELLAIYQDGRKA